MMNEIVFYSESFFFKKHLPPLSTNLNNNLLDPQDCKCPSMTVSFPKSLDVIVLLFVTDIAHVFGKKSK